MATPYFKFKEFTVWHDKCAMKVGTDGVLLGAWVNLSGSQNILDIGTGTGLISLMMAQRTDACINAIDIDEKACMQALENIEASPYRNQVTVKKIDFQQYASTNGIRYDLIVSNPPYFLNSLKGPDSQRNTARHNDSLPLDQLLEGCKKILSPDGRIALILPFSLQDELCNQLSDLGLFAIHKTLVFPTPQSDPKRILVELSTNPDQSCKNDKLVIEESRHQYTNDYKQLTQIYYLKM